MTAKQNREEQLGTLKRLGAYEIRQVTGMKELHADGVVLSHKKTNAHVFLSLTDDLDKVFAISFRTPPQGSTDVMYIIEHIVLCGSEKHRVKDPLIELVKDSLNTFLNMMTYPDRTLYPVASRSPKDFESLMDVYFNAVLHPLFYKEGRTLRQEGWKYELESEDGKLSRNGVIYNEMKGVRSDPDEVMARAVDEALLSGHPYTEESGGDPDLIPDLTYEAYPDFHRRYYHPSNAFIYLCGDPDMAERLCYLGENYLLKHERLAIDSAIPVPKPLAAPVPVSRPYSIDDAESEENTACVSLSVRVGGQLELVSHNAFQVLDYALLKAPGAALHDRLIEEGFEDDIYGGYVNGIREPYSRITVKHLRREQRGAFVRCAWELFTEPAEDGLDYEVLLTAVSMVEFRAREVNFGSYPKGLIRGLQSFENRIYDGNPCLHLKFTGFSDAFRSKVGDNCSEELIREKLLDDEEYAVAELCSVHGFTTKHRVEDAEKLSAVKATITAEERGALIHSDKETRAYQGMPDSEAVLRTIPIFSYEDLAAENTPLCYRTGALGGTPSHYAMWNTMGIGYLRLDFNMGDLPVGDLLALAPTKDLFGHLSTEVHSYTKLSTLVNLHAGGVQFGTDNYPDLVDFRGDRRVFSASVKFLTEKMEQTLNLVNGRFLQTLFTDEARIRSLIGEIRAGLRDTLPPVGNIAVASRVASYFNGNNLFQDMAWGIVHYRFLESLPTESAHYAFCERAPKLLRETVVCGRLLMHLTAEEADKEALLPLLRTLGEYYPADSKGEIRFRPVGDIRRGGFRSTSHVNYVARVGNFRTGDFRYTDALHIAQTMLNHGYLWNEICSKGGAYDRSVRFGCGGNVAFSPYRDPRLEATDKVYEGTPVYLEHHKAGEREMTKTIIDTIGEMDTPRSAQMSGQFALTAYYSEVTDEMLSAERREVLMATPTDVRVFAPLVREALRYEVKYVIGNESVIERAEDFFTEIPPVSYICLRAHET